MDRQFVTARVLRTSTEQTLTPTTTVLLRTVLTVLGNPSTEA
jgi:hypothetical protein